MTVGQRIQKSRKEKKLTQKELAAQLGLATGTIQQYELGKRQPRLEQFKVIASALDVDVNWLMNGYTLEQKEQAMKGSVARRYAEAETWLSNKGQMGILLAKLNDEGQQKAIERVEELTQIPKYQSQAPQEGTEGK